MELNECFLHPYVGLGMSDQERLVMYWHNVKEKFKEGPSARPEARC
jgi:hypothetical protein